MMNEEILRGKWNDIKGEIRSQWGKMTDDELERSSGNFTSLVGLIQQRYGAKKEEVQEKLESIVERFNDRSDDMKDEMRRQNQPRH